MDGDAMLDDLGESGDPGLQAYITVSIVTPVFDFDQTC
jgi:hypothetical protein